MNFKHQLLSIINLNESDSTDLDYTPTQKVDDIKKRDLDINEYQDFEDENEPDVTKEEFKEILTNIQDDEASLINMILQDNDYPFVDVGEILVNIDTMHDEIFADISDLILSILYEYHEYQPDFEQYDDINTSDQLVSEMVDVAETLKESGEEQLAETLVNIAHTRELRRTRRKSSWRREAVLRARFRKTGVGLKAKKKAKKYLKKYRRQHKSRLKRYSQVYAQKWKNNKN